MTDYTPTYQVMGGQGLRRIASGVTREEAERIRRDFDLKCDRYGLTNPPTQVQEETWRRPKSDG